MANLIAVVGMHRSGTSALTGTLVRAGAWFGDPALAAGARPHRPLGLVEWKDFVALTEPALQAVGCSWHDVFSFRPAWDDRYATQVRAQFQTSVLADLLSHPVSVLKDPRLCLLLSLFQPVMKPSAAVFIVRNPLEVAMSLAARNQFAPALGVALWEAYNRHALRALRGVPTLLVQHRRLITRKAIPEIVEGLAALGIAGLSAEAAIASRSIILHLHHNRAEEAGFGLSAEQRDFWRSLRHAQALGDIPVADISGPSLAVLEAHHRAQQASNAS